MHSNTIIFCFIEASLIYLVSKVDAFSLPLPLQRSVPQLCLQAAATPTGTNHDNEWLNHGLLISSFSDGLKPNPQAIDFLMRGLVASLCREQQQQAEEAVKQSVVQSPCCGPDLEAVKSMEWADVALVDLEEGRVRWEDVLNHLVEHSSTDSLELRFLYIPTAMYALRRDSTNSPGIQRQRARADGKKRRNEIVNLLSHKLNGKVSIRTVTLDLDDSSIKHLDGHDGFPAFPKDGKEAFNSWKPNLIYVQGGNTFWLYHCIEKGGWSRDIVNACTGDHAAVYCGNSAGAIIMGKSVATACWKQWDDPSVVPNRGTYEDWNDIGGLRLVGSTSFFPHMNEDWQGLVDSKKSQLIDSEKLIALRDDEVCCVHGGQVQVVSSALIPTP